MEKSAASSGATQAGQSIEQDLMHALRFGGLEKEHLADIIHVLNSFHQKGIPIQKVFTRGTPRPDQVVVHSAIGAGHLNALIQVLKETPQIDNVVVFPNGIPWPEIFRAEFTIR